LRMANAVVAGVLWHQHPQALSEAESAISAMLPNSVPLGVIFGLWPVVIVA
jgi:formate hydrogenlyase subunit 3/multisubunit Na+/H+ antiporter MnhD subunit